MENMDIRIHQMVEHLVHTHLLTAILRTLNEMSYKMQHPDHQTSDRCFDREIMDEEICSIRETIQRYFDGQLSTKSDSSD